MEQVSELCNVSISELEALNPQYRTHLIPGNSGPCTLRLPSTNIASFISKQDTIYNHRLNELQSKRRTIAMSDTKVSTRQTRNRSNSRKSSARSSSTHKIRRGESLSTIARRHGTTVKKLQQLNGISGTNIRAGQTIRVK